MTEAAILPVLIDCKDQGIQFFFIQPKFSFFPRNKNLKKATDSTLIFCRMFINFQQKFQTVHRLNHIYKWCKDILLYWSAGVR